MAGDALFVLAGYGSPDRRTMMAGHLAALAAATALLVAIPGPNVAMIVANSIRHGVRFGLVTVAGTTAGVAVQLMLIVSGFAALLSIAADVLTWVRWVGVLYLLYLGIRTWREPAGSLDDVVACTEPVSRLFWRGMMLAVVNPKTLIFTAAFLPQFVDPSADSARQMVFLGLTFLAVLSAGDVAWATAAGSARPLILKYGRLRNKITGGFLTASGLGLALSQRDGSFPPR
jgi:threonine/homoserine/homoserine lactone efflux protein